MSKNQFDYIIVGSGISALLRCLELERSGKRGCLIEKEETLGGFFRGLRSNEVLFDSHLQYVPTTSVSEATISQLKDELPSLAIEKLNVGPITFQNGQIQPFVGFGATENSAVDLYSQFTQAEQYLFPQGTHFIAASLREKITAQIFNLSEVTSLELQPQVQALINGTTLLSANDLYFFDSPLKLSKLLSNSKTPLPKTLVPKLSKTELWTAVSLIYIHKSPPTQSQAVHMLYGSKEEPCVGRFQHENSVTTSQWLSLVGAEAAMDSEALGATIREMKKQIKRMYPTFFESIEKENIVIAPESYGHVNPQLLENNGFAKVPHLFVGGHFYTNGLSLYGDLTSVPAPTTQITHRDISL
ncbi:NAD(P)-binding protein [bacterium]|nr:NAD(P)-binding protein [bacterium]